MFGGRAALRGHAYGIPGSQVASPFVYDAQEPGTGTSTIEGAGMIRIRAKPIDPESG